jgi:signal transduction histidine kinase/CheY-like chemotaxis protein
VQSLLFIALALQVAAVAYGVLLLWKHRGAPAPWLFLLATLSSMLSWRVVVATGVAPSPAFTTVIAIWGAVGALLAMFFFGREVTRRARAEAQRDELLNSERSARQEAERASRVKDRFLATLSHELRTPLTAILGWSAILRSTRHDAETERGLDIIERNARVQARLVEDLLDATRIQTGALHLEHALVALSLPVEAAIEAVKPQAAAKNISIEYLPIVPSPIVFGDASRLQQVMSNLLVNAVKFSPDGAVVRVSVATDGADVWLRVADEGMGISDAFMPQLFQPFQQADPTQTRRHGGLGLGLSIVATLVRMHGGVVGAESDGPGKGSTFTVRLPVRATAAAAATVARSSVDRAAGDAALRDVRILVVDDEPDVRATVVALLEQHGARVVALESGHAIDVALSAFRPQLLLLDIGLPDEDGYMLLRRLRASQGSRAIPAVSLTAHARDEDRAHALSSGFQAHLVKPVDVDLLVTTIRRLVPSAAIT